MGIWQGDPSWHGWWWVTPLVCLVLCIVMCRLLRARTDGRGFCCGGSRGDADVKRVEREVGELKEEIGQLKQTRR